MSRKLSCIMLIDDDEPTNFLSSMIIEEAQCTRHLQIEDSAAQALDYLTNSAKFNSENENYPWPELIFLDINMPAMNGWEFLEKYKDFDKSHLTKAILIMLTTSLNPDDSTKALNIPAVSGFEIKPLTRQLLEKVLSTFFIPNKLLSK